MKVGLTALLTCVLLVAAVPAAQAVPVLDAADAAELAAVLADAGEAQGVCYGWSVLVNDQGGGGSGQDLGSNRGVGEIVDLACPRQVTLSGTVEYTCGSCEAEDSASISVDANFEGAPTVADLEALGFSADDLLADDNDIALINMVGALPLITASNGAAPPVSGPMAAEADKPAPGDGPTGTPSTPDWLRDSWLGLVFFGMLFGGGVIWLVRLRRAEASNQRTGFSPSTPPDP